VRANCGLAIGEVTAERVKLEVGCCMQLETPLVTQVRGRDPVTGLPREVDVTSDNVREAIEAPIVDIIDATKATLEQTPPELASDITERGITLAGGGALLRGFAERIELETRVPVAIADEPLTCVALGAALALEEMELLERTATAV
jgi:rod shape-determining protein MreB